MKRRDISFNLLKKRSVFITTTTVAIERDIDPSFETLSIKMKKMFLKSMP